MKPLPLGVVAPEGEDFEILHRLAQKPLPYYERKNLLYLNFSPFTNKAREATKNLFKHMYQRHPNVLIVEERLKWKDYLQNIGESQFVLSPPGKHEVTEFPCKSSAILGNGIDCLRTWEALAMGAVPIVLNSELAPLYEGMPVMVVSDWSEVTEERMLTFQNETLRTFSSDEISLRPKLWLRYWINEIMSVKQNYITNVC